MILILDYGSQYTQLIARRVREQNVYSEVKAFDDTIDHYQEKVEGVILSGGPASVYSNLAPFLPDQILEWGVPILGICYGAQLLAQHNGGKVEAADKREFGQAELHIVNESELFQGIPTDQKHIVWMSHGDRIESIGDAFEVIATSNNSPFAAFEDKEKRRFNIQFHPEVVHTSIGTKLLENFVQKICQCEQKWTMDHFVSSHIQEIKTKVGKDHVICGLSGGVDSSVVSALLHKALGRQLTAIFVDHGLLRKNERKQVEHAIGDALDMNLIVVDAKDRFLKGLEGISDPEEKRKIIGRTFIEVFDEEASKIPNVKYLAQGTLYPDVIESVSHRGPSVTIKSHHNVGGLPERMKLELIEPVRELFKDEVRKLGRELSLPEKLIERHPFPGPGLAIRILGEITEDRIDILQEADAIFIEELHTQSLYHETWQAFAVLLPVQTVGVMGDERTYENVCALRAVTSIDGMTAKWAELPYDFLSSVSSRICNEVRGINRVVYDISSKPPATIEWE